MLLDYIEIIEDRSRVLQALVEQFYELSVIEDSNVELELEPLDVTVALTNCLLGNYALFEEKGIQPESRMPEQAVMIISNSQALERFYTADKSRTARNTGLGLYIVKCLLEKTQGKINSIQFTN